MDKLGDIPTVEEFVKELEESLEYCKEADDMGSVHFCMGRWQEWVNTWPQIFNEDGGI